MKHFKSLLLLSAISLIGIASFSFLPIDNNINKVEASVGNYVTDPNTYYDDVENLTGLILLMMMLVLENIKDISIHILIKMDILLVFIAIVPLKQIGIKAIHIIVNMYGLNL